MKEKKLFTYKGKYEVNTNRKKEEMLLNGIVDHVIHFEINDNEVRQERNK